MTGSPSTASRTAFNALPRLKVAAFLSGCEEAEFKVVAQACGIPDAALSKAATILAEAGFLRIRKGHVGRRPKTWLALTAAGRRAYAAHMKVMRDLSELATRQAATARPPA
jgi:DNA-binding MarR family transcriptional regulator